MNSADRSRLLTHLQARHAAIADHWYAAVARTSFIPRPTAQVRATLNTLTEQLIEVLVSEPFEPARAREAGAALAALHYNQPDALAGTLDALAQQLTEGLTAQQTRAVNARLAALLGAVAAGFFAQSRDMILDEQDQIRRAFFVTRQRAEQAEEARAAAEASVRVRTDVLNAAAHDLRSPVTTILGHVDLLRLRLDRDPPPPPDWLRKRTASIRAGAMRIRAMVDELLDVARLQTGQTLELHIEDVDVGDLVREVVLPRESSTSGVSPLVVDAPSGLVVEADRARLERVIENILGNAIKYSPPSSPVHVVVRPHDEGVTISVQDAGVGIPADELPRLFTPFFRASTAHGVPGIGIGLSGVKTIVEQHGGRIAVESTVGQGTTVTITLPSAQPPAEDPS